MSSAKHSLSLSHNSQTSGDIKYITEDQVYHKRNDGSAWHSPYNVLGQDGQQIVIKHGRYYVRVYPCRVKLVKSHPIIEQCIQSDDNGCELNQSTSSS